MKAMTAFGKATEVLEERGRVSPAFGIDLGTTNSAIAVIQSGNTPKIITLDGGAKTMPSCVQWKGKPGEFVVGKEAYNNRYKASSVYSVKRLMGTDELVVLKYGTRETHMTPAEVSAQILKELVRQASKEYKDIKDVIITVPAYFDSKQISATIEAGKLAGLNVLSTLREPTAASLVYATDSKKDGTVLVYDLGGGTMDASLLRITHTEGLGDDLASLYGIEEEGEGLYSVKYTVLDTDGDSHLGGDDIDQELYKILEGKISALGYDVKQISREDKEKLILRLERMKKSGAHSTTMDLNLKLGKTSLKEKIEITYADFVAATRVVYLKSKRKVDAVIGRAGKINITSITLVGGSTKSQILRDMLAKDFPDVFIDCALNPDESVALGAAVKAKEAKFGDKNVEVFDILPLSIGIVSDGYVTPVIRKNQRIPCSAKRRYSTVVDNQEKLEIQVYQGNSSLKEECQYLGTLLYENVPKGEAGKVNVIVTQSVDSNGVLTVAVETENGKEEVALVNVLGSSAAVKKTPADRRVVKWIAFANEQQGSVKLELLEAIEKYQEGTVTKEEVASLIAKCKKEVPEFSKYEKPELPDLE